MLTHGEMLTRIAAGALLGACVGYERARHGRSLGLRTHILVSLAAATFTVISSQFPFYQQYEPPSQLLRVDTSRIAAAIVSAVGFLAGGSIMRSGNHVQGLTSAAGLWLVTAIGMCTGAGMYVEGVFATALGLFSLGVVRRFEDKREFPVRGCLTLRQRERLSDLCGALERADMVVVAIEDPRDGAITVRFELKKAAKRGLIGILKELEAAPAVDSVSIERMG
jgi:putative Mg2+ transporter-C (MgtC) family protein